MKKRNKSTGDILEQIAAQNGVSVGEVVRDMQAAIDATWNNPDPVARAKQRRLFPDGKPSIQKFLRVVTKHMKH